MTRSAAVREAAAALARGELVALPTETYFALGADALHEPALKNLLERKGRDATQTLSLLIEPELLPLVVAEVPPAARALMAAHWPGPLTLALPARPGLPVALVQADCVAVRVSPDPIARALVRALGRPLTATSANPAGAPPPRTAAQVRAYFPDLLVVGEGPTPGGPPSTLVRVTAAGLVELVRAGPIAIDVSI
ncbi:MAG TPA: L-threonylcarbamoyladenylate synthase [Polyangia bacterium]|nr:L-threonylcarbamoyladenylate synthase [Polyangia bacterium]